jgi:hypothetical protein
MCGSPVATPGFLLGTKHARQTPPDQGYDRLQECRYGAPVPNDTEIPVTDKMLDAAWDALQDDSIMRDDNGPILGDAVLAAIYRAMHRLQPTREHQDLGKRGGAQKCR